MVIKEASMKDISLIQELAHRSWHNHYSNIISNEQIKYMLDKMYNKSELILHFENPKYNYFIVILPQNTPIGFIGIEYDFLPDTSKIHRLYFLSEYTGKGYGKKTIDFVKDKISGKQKKMVLNVNKKNPAIKFYQSIGFNIIDEGIFEIGNGFVMDDYIMEYII